MENKIFLLNLLGVKMPVEKVSGEGYYNLLKMFLNNKISSKIRNKITYKLKKLKVNF